MIQIYYEAANFSFYNKQFSKLKELTEEESVELLYNEIIYQEVYQHIEENLTKAVSEYNKVIEGNRAFAPFRMHEKWGEKISQIKPDAMVSELRKRWEDYIDDTCATKISISEVDVDEIVDKYFNKRFPFENKKPTEFKDAICVDSIMQYYDSITDDKVYVVATDKGFRRSFKERAEFVTFSDLNSFLNFAISQTDHLVVEVEKAFESGVLDGCISKLLDNQLYMGSVDVEDVYYDREDGRYYWENFVTYKAVFGINLEIEVSIAIETDEKDLSVSVEVDDVNVDTNIYLHESDIIESEIIHNTMEDYEEEPFDENANYCPECGCKMDYKNDSGAFCSKCAPNH